VGVTPRILNNLDTLVTSSFSYVCPAISRSRVGSGSPIYCEYILKCYDFVGRYMIENSEMLIDFKPAVYLNKNLNSYLTPTCLFQRVTQTEVCPCEHHEEIWQ
jgi:hypothetical protein